MMELNQSFVNKIKRCFKLLFEDNHYVNDDALLEKFSSLLEVLLQSNSENVDIVLSDGLQVDKWIKVLECRWQSLDPGVVAFGINVIRLFTLSQLGLNTLQKHETSIKNVFQCIRLSKELSPSICCSMLKFYRRLIDLEAVQNLIPEDIIEVSKKCLDDGSMYVSRSAKDLLVQFLVRQLSKSDERDKCVKVIRDLFFLIPECKNDKKKVQAILDVILKILRAGPDLAIVSEIAVQLQPKFLENIRDLVDEQVLFDYCNVLLTFKSCTNSECEPNEMWFQVFDALIDKQKIICCAKFISATLEMQIRQKNRSSSTLVAMLMFPLVRFCGKLEAEPWVWNFILYEKFHNVAKDLKSQNRLVNYVISSLTNIQSSFSTPIEKLCLVKVLLYILIDTQSAGHAVKISQVTADTLTKILVVWNEDDWAQNLSVDDQRMIMLESVNLLKRPLHVSMSTRVTKLVLTVMSLPNFSDVWSEIGVELKNIIQLRCHDPMWEIRDSAFELLTGITKLSKGCRVLGEWLRESQLVQLCFLALDDEQDYVKASAIGALASIPDIGCILQPDMVTNVAQILLLDSEGIVRRAAAVNFKEWLERSFLGTEDLKIVYPTMVRCCCDLDWEVKLTAVKFWSLVLTRMELKKMCPAELLVVLSECGFFRAVSILVADEDSSVRHKVFKLLGIVKDLIPETVFDSCDRLVETKPSTFTDVEYVIPAFPSDASLVESVLDTVDSDIMRSKVVPTITKEYRKELFQRLLSETELTCPKNIVSRMKSIEKCGELPEGCLTTDLYELNPESLLDDIITANYESDHEEDLVIDCY